MDRIKNQRTHFGACILRLFRVLHFRRAQLCPHNVFSIIQNAGSKDDFAAKMKVETENKLQAIHAEVAANKEKVIDRLLELIYDINPEVHQNYKPPKTA